MVSDSDRKVGSRHFFNITEPIPAINVPIFSGGILFPPFFPQGEENAQKGHLLSTDPPKGHLLVFEKKKQNAESVLSSGSAGIVVGVSVVVSTYFKLRWKFNTR